MQKLPPLTAQTLSPAQQDQVLRQIDYHSTAPSVEIVPLNDVVQLKLDIRPGVTRPMSSKGLARFLFSQRHLSECKRVADIGTGCGIQSLSVLLAGASHVVASDIADSAVTCAQANISASGYAGKADILKSDLFDGFGDIEPFDLIVFAHPYFWGEPLGEYEFTKGMLDPRGLLNSFFEMSRAYLSNEGKVASMGWTFAGEKSDPAIVGPKHGFKVVHRHSYEDRNGVQRGSFHIVLLRT